MALATFQHSPLPYDGPHCLPMAPFLPRQVISEKRQSGCSDHLASFQFPTTSTQCPSLKLSLRPRRNSDSVMLQRSLQRMSLRGDRNVQKKKQQQQQKKKVQAPTQSIHELAASLMSAKGQKTSRFAKLSNSSPKRAPVQRSASFGRARLSPVRSAPIRTRSCGGLVY